MIFTATVVDNLGRNELGVAAINSAFIKTFMPGRMKEDSPEWTRIVLVDDTQMDVRVSFSALATALGALEGL